MNQTLFDHMNEQHGVLLLESDIAEIKRIVMEGDTLKERYNSICDEWLKLFSEKQELEFVYWIGDTVGEIAVFGDFYFNMSDIIYDINNNSPKGEIIDWYYDNLNDEGRYINYYSYSKGLRIAELKKEEQK